jgi:hypothetical protein
MRIIFAIFVETDFGATLPLDPAFQIAVPFRAAAQ